MATREDLIKEAEAKWQRDQLVAQAEAKWQMDNAKSVVKQDQPSSADAVLRSLVDSATFGLGGKAASAINAAITAASSDKEFGQAYDEEQSQTEQIKAASPTASLIGEIGGYVTPGGAPLAIAKGVSKIPALAGLAQKAAKATGIGGLGAKALSGAASGAAESLAVEGTGELVDAATGGQFQGNEVALDTLAGGGFGGALGAASGAAGLIGKGISTAGKFLAPKVMGAAEGAVSLATGVSKGVMDKYKGALRKEDIAGMSTQELINLASESADAARSKSDDILSQLEIGVSQTADRAKIEASDKLKKVTTDTLAAKEMLKQNIIEKSKLADSILEQSGKSVPVKLFMDTIQDQIDRIMPKGKSISSLSEKEQAVVSELKKEKDRFASIANDAFKSLPEEARAGISLQQIELPAVYVRDEIQNLQSKAKDAYQNQAGQFNEKVPQTFANIAADVNGKFKKFIGPEYEKQMSDLADSTRLNSELDQFITEDKVSGQVLKALGDDLRMSPKVMAQIQNLEKSVQDKLKKSGISLSDQLSDLSSSIDISQAKFSKSMGAPVLPAEQQLVQELSQRMQLDIGQKMAEAQDLANMAKKKVTQNTFRQAFGKGDRDAKEVLQMYKNYLDQYGDEGFDFIREAESASLLEQFGKGGEKSSRRAVTGGVLGGTLGLMVGGPAGAMLGASAGASKGYILDKHGGEVAKKFLDAVISMEGAPTWKKIDKALVDLPEDVRQAYKVQVIQGFQGARDAVLQIDAQDKPSLKSDISSSGMTNVEKAQLLSRLQGDKFTEKDFAKVIVSDQEKQKQTGPDPKAEEVKNRLRKAQEEIRAKKIIAPTGLKTETEFTKGRKPEAY